VDLASTLLRKKELTSEDAIVELAKELEKKKVRLHDVMNENDGLRRGHVPLKKFRNILQKFHVKLDENTWDLLEKEYQSNVIDFN